MECGNEYGNLQCKCKESHTLTSIWLIPSLLMLRESELKSVPPPIQDFRHQEPAGTGELTCRFFHRFPVGTCYTPKPVLSPTSVNTNEIENPVTLYYYQKPFKEISCNLQ